MTNKILDEVFFPPIVEINRQLDKIIPLNDCRFEMCQAVPPYATFSSLRELMSKELMNDSSLSFYTPVEGTLELRQAILEKHPIKFLDSKKHITIASGANQAIYLALTSLFTIGDEVLLLAPYYFNHQMALKMLGLKEKFYFLEAEDGFCLKAKKLINYLKENPVKGLILITPNNPTGACYESSELSELLDYTRHHNIEVIIDETYKDFDPHHLQGLGDEAKLIDSGLTLVGSFSKSYSMTGYRVGYLIHGEKHKSNLLKVQDTMSICAAHFSQRMALQALNNCHEELQEKVHLLQQLQQILKDTSQELKKFKITSVGPFFAFLQHPFQDLDAQGASLKLYQLTGIRSLPGSVFGPNFENFLRLAYCNLSIEQLQKAMKELLRIDQ